MEIILQKQIRRLGKAGDKVNVADGYARNYLIPNSFAVRATNDNIAKLEANKQELELRSQEDKKIAEASALKVQGKSVIFTESSSSDGRLFGSITAKIIASALSKLTGVELSYSNISLATPIKANGVYNVQVILHPEVITEVMISVAKTESEAEQALADSKTSESNKEVAQEE